MRPGSDGVDSGVPDRLAGITPMAPSLRILPTEVPVPGLKRRLRILQASDLNLCECDRRDPDRLEALSRQNRRLGGLQLAYLDQLVAEIPHLAPDFVALTGDLMESATSANLDTLSSRLESVRVPFGLTLGERDWDAPADWGQERRQAHRERLWIRFIGDYRWSPEFEDTIVGGVRLVMLDNSDYQIRLEQLRKFNTAVRGAEPVVLFCHVPLSLPYLRRAVIAKWQDPILCGESDWDPRRRARWGILSRNTTITRRFRAVALETPGLAAAFAGHVQLDRKDRIPGGGLQWVTPALSQGFARMITLAPAPKAEPQEIDTTSWEIPASVMAEAEEPVLQEATA